MQDLASTIDALRATYLGRLPERAKQIRDALGKLADGPVERAAPARSEAERLCHNLVGTAGAYGLRDLSDAAARLCDKLASACDEDAREVEGWPEVEQLFCAFEVAVAAAPRGPG